VTGLQLDVRVEPDRAPATTPTTVTAVLRNTAQESRLVNRRMLLNHPGGSGEVWFELRGPEGWQNRAGFRINAGRAPAEFYVELGPGDSIEHSWNLDDYATTDTAGRYELTLTYHSDGAMAPDGRRMPEATVTGSASFERTT
jgi:hypothetical protein